MGVNKEIRILLVEDDDINRKLLANILKTLGFNHVSEADNGRSAWEMMQEEKFDLVMTDWMMPEMDGLQLLKAIREESIDQKQVPVLMITALGKQDDIMKAAKLEIDGYIVKPFSVNTVLAKIEEILG
ncbi:MAG: response regulator [Proteobacteria bacterium]|nr:response regulator [Pseudomonadota bacterium]